MVYLCLDHRLTFDVNVIEILTLVGKREVRHHFLSQMDHDTNTYTLWQRPAYPDFSEWGDSGQASYNKWGGGGGGWGGGGLLSASNPI